MMRSLIFSVVILWANFAVAEPVKVGCLYPLSGSGGVYGRDSIVAIDMALDHLTALGGYPEIDVTVEDSRSKTLRSLQIARQFVEEDQVNFLCGIVSSSIALTVSEYARQSGKTFIGTDHASPDLVGSSGHENYFRVNNGSRQSMRAGAMYIKEHFAKKPAPLRIGFIGPDYSYSYNAWSDIRRFLSEENIDYDITGVYWPKLFEDDYRLYIRQISADAPDILIDAHWGMDLETFVRQADQLGLFQVVQFMNFDTGGNYEILAELGADMPEGLILSARHHLNWPETAANAAFVEEFHRRAGRYPSYAAEGAWSGIMVIAEAVRRAEGVKNTAALNNALKNMRLSLPEDPEGFMSFMDPASHQMMQVQAIGRTMPNNQFPPAEMMLGDFSVYTPPNSWPHFTDN